MALDLRDKIAGKLRNLVAVPMERGTKSAKILAVASSKGGVGKTTTCVNLAVEFARRGLDVLLVDLDPQAHVAASLHIEAGPKSRALADVLLGKLREVREATYASGTTHLALAGSDKGLAETEMVLSSKIGKEMLLRDALTVTRTYHDLIILDCPPNLGTLTLNALCAAEHLLVPSDMSVLALEGVGDILTAVETVRSRLGHPIELLGVVATRYDKRATQMNQTITQSFTDLFGDALLHTHIPQSTAVNKAHLAGKPVADYAPRSPGASAYAALASEVQQRLGLAEQSPVNVATTAVRSTSR